MYIPKSPIVLSLDLTNQCNLYCPHCLADADLNGASFSKNMVMSIINEAIKLDIKEIALGGGEVLLYKDFFEICEYILSNEIGLAFTTNGLLVSENMDSFLNLKTYDTSFKVGISLDGHNSDLHGYFRPKETFEIALNSINILMNADIDVHILTVLNKKNINYIPEILDFFSHMGISDIRFIPFMPVGRGEQFRDEMLSPDDFYSILHEKHNLSNIYKINIGLQMPWDFLLQPPKNRHPNPCEAGYLRLWIDSNGDIFPCAFLSDSTIGNVYHDSISDVWLNSPILRQLRDPTLLNGTCSSCSYRDDCRGGCRGLAQFLGGNFLCSDPYCPIVNLK